MVQKLVDIQPFSSPTTPRIGTTTTIALVGGSNATAGAKQIPTGTVVRAVNTPVLVSSLQQGRDLFGWLSEPSGSQYTGTWALLPKASGSGASRIAQNTIPEALELIFANANVNVIVSRFDDSTTSTARQTNINAALTALRDNNNTGFDPDIIVIPEESWAGATPDGTKIAAYTNLQTICESLECIGIMAMPPFTAAVSVTGNGATWVNNTDEDGSRILRVFPHVIPARFSTRFDPSPAVAGALANFDETNGIHANPRGITLSGVVRPTPLLSHSPISATVQSAILRHRNVCPIVSRNGIRLFGTKLGYDADSSDVLRFLNVQRVQDRIVRRIQHIAEVAADLNANEARGYLSAQTNAMLSSYAARGSIRAPSFTLDPQRDTGGSEIYCIVTYTSVNPAEKITIRIGPR